MAGVGSLSVIAVAAAHVEFVQHPLTTGIETAAFVLASASSSAQIVVTHPILDGVQYRSDPRRSVCRAISASLTVGERLGTGGFDARQAVSEDGRENGHHLPITVSSALQFAWVRNAKRLQSIRLALKGGLRYCSIPSLTALEIALRANSVCAKSRPRARTAPSIMVVLRATGGLARPAKRRLTTTRCGCATRRSPIVPATTACGGPADATGRDLRPDGCLAGRRQPGIAAPSIGVDHRPGHHGALDEGECCGRAA